LLAVGISKIIASRPLNSGNAQGAPDVMPRAQYDMNPGPPIRQTSPHPLFSTPASGESAQKTGELEPVRPPSMSVTEDDTRHLPNSGPPHELSR
jgi:hypothetical protein